MHSLTQDLIRAAVALQVAALEWDNSDVRDADQAGKGLDESLKQIQKTVKKMKAEF